MQILCMWVYLSIFSYSIICQWHWLGVHHIQRPRPHWHGPAVQLHRDMQPRERHARFTNHWFYRCPSAHVPACDNGRGCVKLDYTTCLPIAWGHRNLIFRSKEADLQVLEFHFSVFFTGCRIGQESLTGLKHGTKCSSPSTQQTWISSVEIGALFLAWLCAELDHGDHFFDEHSNFNEAFLYI